MSHVSDSAIITVDDLSTVFTKSICEAITYQPEQQQIINSTIQDAEREISECSLSLNAIEDISIHVKNNVIPQLQNNLKNMIPVFESIDYFQQETLPKLLKDIDSLENIVSLVEKQQAELYPSTIQSWFNTIRKPLESTTFLSIDCVLHDPVELIEELKSKGES